jgi:hypothetical protein
MEQPAQKLLACAGCTCQRRLACRQLLLLCSLLLRPSVTPSLPLSLLLLLWPVWAAPVPPHHHHC